MIGSILGGLVSKGGSDAAAGAINQATLEAQAENKAQRDFNYSQASPWISGGRSAMDKIGQLLGFGTMVGEGGQGGAYKFTGDYDGAVQRNALAGLQTSPGYQFRLGEGIKALDRSAAAKGRLLSGAQIKGVQSFGEGLASDEYRNYIGDLFNVAGMGNQAQGANAGVNSGLVSQNGNNTMQGAVARGSAYQAGANALASGIGQGINNVLAGAYMFRNQLFGGGGQPGQVNTGIGRTSSGNWFG